MPPRRSWRAAPAIALFLPAAAVLTSMFAPPSAGAAAQPAAGQVDVIEVSGLIDRINVDYVVQSLKVAARDHAEVLVVQLDSGGGVVGPAFVNRLVRAVSQSVVPVAVWVGGRTGARAYGTAFDLFRASAVSGVAPSGHVGEHGRAPAAAGPTATGATPPAPTLGDFIVDLDGLHVTGRTLHTARVVQSGGEPRREPTVTVSFGKLGLLPRLLHTAASPSVAYLLLVIGLLLVVFEFFTIGVGLGAASGIIALTLGAYGLGSLPVRPLAVGIVVASCLGFAVDVQAGAPRAWTVIATVALAAGTLSLFRGVHASPLAMVVGVVGTPLFMIAGMPAMVRARFATPTIGRQAMIGELGAALGDVAPDGTVEVRGAPWRARTNRATPIRAGDQVRVTGIDGLLLEVEPEAGGARDYRH